jgi:hypothetical protein
VGTIASLFLSSDFDPVLSSHPIYGYHLSYTFFITVSLATFLVHLHQISTGSKNAAPIFLILYGVSFALMILNYVVNCVGEGECGSVDDVRTLWLLCIVGTALITLF